MLRDHAVQLHGHRRQPADRARADGQHGGVEARRRRAALGNWHFMKLLEEAGPAAGRDQLPARRSDRGEPHACSADRDLAGIHFTGSTAVFQTLWRSGRREHRALRAATRASSARPAARTSSSRTRAPTRRRSRSAMVRGAFEYQGQKCSAASRAYIPQTLWPAVRDRVLGMIADIRMGDVADFRNFMGAVIDRARVRPDHGLPRPGARRTRRGRSSPVAGADDADGWFVRADAARRSRTRGTARCAKRSSARC